MNIPLTGCGLKKLWTMNSTPAMDGAALTLSSKSCTVMWPESLEYLALIRAL